MVRFWDVTVAKEALGARSGSQITVQREHGLISHRRPIVPEILRVFQRMGFQSVEMLMPCFAKRTVAIDLPRPFHIESLQ